MRFILALLMAALIFYRLIQPLRIRRIWKIVLAVPLAAACCKYEIIHLFGGPMFFAPDLPGWILISSAWLYAVVFLLFFLLLAMEIIRLAVKIWVYFRWHRPLSENCRKNLHRITLGLAAAAVLLATLGLYEGKKLPEIREREWSFPNLPSSADGIRIAVLADLHADRATRAPHIARIVQRVNAARPDLIVLLGDFVDGRIEKRGQELLPLRDLKAPLGVYAVPGNHEYYSGYVPWMKHLRELGLRMLENEHSELPNGIWLAGVADPAGKRTGDVLPDLSKALKGIPDNRFILLLAHQPGQARIAADHGVSLQLSGHTHGGMILGFDRIVALFNGGFVSGLYQVNAMKLYVSNGTGIWNGFPIRLGHNSEITLVTLKRRN